MNEAVLYEALMAGQYRAARSMLGWSLIETARHADISPISVLAAEKEFNTATDTSRRALAAAYQAAGVSFHGSTTDGFGLTLRSPMPDCSSNIP